MGFSSAFTSVHRLFGGNCSKEKFLYILEFGDKSKEDRLTVKVLQLANGYLGSKLYELLFASLKSRGVENIVYVPLNKNASLPLAEVGIFFSPCFTDLDRLLFFSKQKKILQDITEKHLFQEISLVHAHTVFSGGYTALQLYKQHNIPYIVAVRNTDINLFFKKLPHLRQTGLRILESAERIIFLSPAYQEQVFSHYIPSSLWSKLEKKSLIIPNGIAPLFFEAHPSQRAAPKSSLRLIYVGEITSNKNLETTVQATKLLRAAGLDVHLIVVGAILDKKYFSIIEKTDFLEYHDRCPQTEVIKFLRRADIFVMPSHIETFGLVYAEAMSQGLPVIYTRGQGFDGQFPEGTAGYAVSDKDPAELAEAVQKILIHYEILSKNCLKLVKKFEWHCIAAQYQTLYEQIHLTEGGPS